MRQRKPVPVYNAVFPAQPPNLNDVLYAMTFKTDRPEWLEGCPDIKIVRMKPDSYQNHVNKHGWESVRKHLEAAKDLVPKHKDFEAQKAILSDLGMPELACYDGSIADIIDLVPITGTYEEGLLELQIRLISLLSKQLENGGSTLFFDIDELATTPGSVLVPQIVKRREQELKDIVLYQYGTRVNLMPIWFTGFGFNILKALGCKSEETIHNIPQLLKRFSSDLGIDIPLKETKSRKKFSSLNESLSQPLIEHVRTLVT
jgi:hypothetical protein